MATILCVDNEQSVGSLLQGTLVSAGHHSMLARNAGEVRRVLAAGAVDLIVSDDETPGMSGLELLALLQEEGCQTPLIVLTRQASSDHAAVVMKAGAIDCIAEPACPEQIGLAVDRALEVSRLRRENDALRREVMGLRSERQIVGDGPAIRRILQTVAMAAPTRATVLIQGEGGSGKKLLARAIHDQSDRRDQTFVQLNCAALPEVLVAGALFGHETVASSGGSRQVEGALERADGGTLLLDEISELRLDMQSKLLRVLREQELERVGGTESHEVDVRVVATTSRDLAAEVKAGRFRPDLYDRLSLLAISVPPLRERSDDVPILACRFAMRTAREMGKEVTEIAPEAMALLQRYEWPGNVRELQHAVERAVILSTGPVLQPHTFDQLNGGHAATQPRTDGPFAELISAGTRAATDGAPVERDEGVRLPTLNVEDAERLLIRAALERTGNNRTRAAKLLGMSVRTLRSKLNAPNAEPVAAADVAADD